jgi:hypothetical protein
MGLFFGSVLEYLVKAIGSSIKAIAHYVHSLGSGKWPKAEAIVSANPERFERFGGVTVEIVYSYRFKGELYTGLHEEACFTSSNEYIERFAKGRPFIVRVKPGEPDVSLVLEEDQTTQLVIAP